MFRLATRTALGFSAVLFSAVLNAIFTALVVGGQWLASLGGDSALLSFELLVTLLSLGLLSGLINRADKLARAVGTVRRGSPEEKQADRVMARFKAVDTAFEYLFYAFFPRRSPGLSFLMRISRYTCTAVFWRWQWRAGSGKRIVLIACKKRAVMRKILAAPRRNASQ